MREILESKGITLIALIITIIVLLILAGITISLTVGQNGIMNMAEQAGKNYINAEQKEKNDLEELYSSIMVATDDDAKITISMEDLNALIDSKVEAKINAITMKSPILLTKAVLPSTGGDNTRAVGTYKASSAEYTKTNEENMSNYLTFEENVGWTVQKDGFYYIKIAAVNVNSDGTNAWVYGDLYINNERITHNRVQHSTYNTASIDEATTVYLNKGDVLDFSLVQDAAARWSTASLEIYAQFE